MITRRETILSTLFGSGLLGLRALATGLPVSFLANPRRAIAADACAKDKAQYVIFHTSGAGDPINANVPGTYEDAKIVHPADAAMAPTKLTLGGQPYTAAAPWASLPQSVLDRTTFWHLMTNTPVHPKEPDVLKLMGTTYAGEMLPSLMAKVLAPCLGTIQTQPITLGATSPAEGLSFGGSALPIIPPLALRATLTTPQGPLSDLQALRDQTLGKLVDLYKASASTPQKRFMDSLVTSQQEVRNINQSLLGALDAIKDNTAASQASAALTLIQMNVTPVVAIHIPFGGDNHRDVGLAAETAQTVSGVATIASLMQQLQAAGLQDKVTFVSLDVFGRTIGPGNADGRQHNPNHQVSLTIGKPFKPGVIGGVGPVGKDYGALAIESKTGRGAPGGDVHPTETLASFGKTVLAGLGADAGFLAQNVTSGTVLQPALA